jgi:hypothetical protein
MIRRRRLEFSSSRRIFLPVLGQLPQPARPDQPAREPAKNPADAIYFSWRAHSLLPP